MPPSTTLEIDLSFKEAIDEIAHTIPDVRFLHSWETYRSIVICTRLGLLKDPYLAPRLREYWAQGRMIHMLKRVGAQDPATKFLDLAAIAASQKVADDLTTKRGKKGK